MRRICLVLALFSAALALIASGCGGGDGSAESTTAASKDGSAISELKFLVEANAICAKANQELAKTSETFAKENLSKGAEPTKAQIGELVKLVLPTITRQVEEIRALGAPAGDEEKVEAILSAVEDAIRQGESDPAAIYGANGGAFAKANRLSADYGLVDCSE